MVSLQPSLDALLKSIPPRPIPQKTLDELVGKTVTESIKLSSAENRKSQWEYLLKNEIFLLAATEGRALKEEDTPYYDQLRDKLDLILTFTEHEACEQTFPFIVLQDLLETQTIASCSHIFSWIEARAKRLTEGMVPQKGKALILLRTLNDLLRRLSKMGTTTIFCGRILTFLSGVFPLGERSGVNLRGEYGPTWEGVKEPEKERFEEKDAELKSDVPDDAELKKGVEGETEKMQVDEAKSEKEAKKSAPASMVAEKKDDFYTTFWSLQLPFSKPPLFSAPTTFVEFKDAVNKVLPVIKEATAKERAMMGSRSSAGTAGSLKRKREPDTVEEISTNEYFFAKFLTSPDLLDLEIADTHFRRQFLFQLLILLNHLLTFTKAAKSTWSSSRNRSLQMDFTLETAEAQWVQETLNKAMEELRQTTPNGRAFAETVNVILEREKNWVKWKNELCAPFDKEPWVDEVDGKKVGLEEATRETRKKMREEPKEWNWALGTEPLTEIWEMGYRDLHDLQNPFQAGDVKDFVKKVKQEEARIEIRKKALARTAERLAAKIAASKTSSPAPPHQPSPEKEPAASTSKSEMLPPASDPGLTPSNSTSRPMTMSTSATSLNPASSPLHPSLPAKPGLNSPSKPLSSSQESARSLTPVPPPPAPAPPPVVATSAPAPAPVTAPITSTPSSTDDQIAKFEENKQRWSWLALRTARDQYLQHFGKIGTGNIELLAQEIEKEQQEREKLQRGEEMSGTAGAMGTVEEQATESPMITAFVAPPGPVEDIKPLQSAPDGEGDVKMEDR